MGSGWENPGPARQVIIAGSSGEMLVYSGTPAAGNLILAISAAAGTDAFGNQFSSGLSILGNAAIGKIAFAKDDGSSQGALYDNGAGNGVVLMADPGQALFLRSGIDSILALGPGNAGAQIAAGSFGILDSGQSQVTILAGTNSVVSAAIPIPSGASAATCKIIATSSSNAFACNNQDPAGRAGTSFVIRVFKTDGTNVAVNTTVKFDWVVFA